MMTRHLTAVLLAGGWILLFNPQPGRPTASISGWEEVDDYDTSYDCERGRREEIREFAEREHLAPARVELRYRCERTERVHPPAPTPGLQK